MTYRRMPLYPPGCDMGSSLQVPLFENCSRYRPGEECQCVHIENPSCPGEYADVELCVDECGNLSICVKRPPKPCNAGRCKSRRQCNCPSWYR